MKKIKRFLNLVWPFISVLALWGLSSPFWNPAGVLAIIPIFYFSFVQPRDFFVPMTIFGCILIDYNFDTVLFWTIMFCIVYVVNTFQSYIDITRQKYNGIYIFMGFYGLCLLILGLWYMFQVYSMFPILQIIWLFLWGCVLYIPFVTIGSRLKSVERS